MPSIKRERSITPADNAPAPTPTASSAIHRAIALVSSTSPARRLDLDVQLLAIISEAAALSTAQEDRELDHDRKRIKHERPSLEPQAANAAQLPPAAAQQGDRAPMPSFWGLSAIQGELSDLEDTVLRDIEAGLPLLDKLVRPPLPTLPCLLSPARTDASPLQGILLRPVKGSDDKVNLLEWEALFSVKVADSNWRGAFFRPRVIFTNSASPAFSLSLSRAPPVLGPDPRRPRRVPLAPASGQALVGLLPPERLPVGHRRDLLARRPSRRPHVADRARRRLRGARPRGPRSGSQGPEGRL